MHLGLNRCLGQRRKSLIYVLSWRKTKDFEGDDCRIKVIEKSEPNVLIEGVRPEGEKGNWKISDKNCVIGSDRKVLYVV